MQQKLNLTLHNTGIVASIRNCSTSFPKSLEVLAGKAFSHPDLNLKTGLLSYLYESSPNQSI
jgi:hypothetical protein